MMQWSAQFINFSKEYDQVLWSETLAELDPEVYVRPEMIEKVIATGDISFTKRSNDLLRVIDISAEDLWKDGSEEEKYTGNKWGGKYLRAPEIFFTVLEKGGEKLVKLKKISDVRFWIKTWVNDFFYLPSKSYWINDKWHELELVSLSNIKTKLTISKKYFIPVIKSPRECNFCKSSKISSNNYLFVCYESFSELPWDVIDYIKRWEFQWFNKWASVNWRKNWYSVPDLKKPDYVYPLINNDQLKIIMNDANIAFDANLNCWFSNLDNNESELLPAVLMCSLTMIYRELYWIANLWEWAIKQNPQYTMHSLLIHPKLFLNSTLNAKFDVLSNREMKSIFIELWFDKTKDIRSQTPQPLADRKELDDIIFDELWLTPDERNEVYRSLAELVKARLDKAKSV